MAAVEGVDGAVVGGRDTKRRGILGMSRRIIFFGGVRGLVVHVLRVAGIDHCNGVALDGVGVVPFVGVCHVKTRPSADGRPSARQCALIPCRRWP